MKCEYCGKEFDPVKKQGRKKRYCSRVCYQTSYNLKRGTGHNPNPEPFEKECVVCGKKFKTRRETTTTCSHECAIEKARRNKKSGKRHYDHTWSEWVELQRKKKEEAEAVKKIEKRFYQMAHTVERECVICGTVFYCLDKVCNKTCSTECSKKLKNKKRDKRLSKEQIIDSDITNHRLYVRDKGVCWLCRGVCDWNDLSIINGQMRYGDKYPSIDHVIPISLGGMHSWDNVRLAHLGCNLTKSNNLIAFDPMGKTFAYKCKRKPSANGKRTIQKTTEGVIVRIWESTAQIERELKFSSKHIQNVCRGDGKSAYGFLWEYE